MVGIEDFIEMEYYKNIPFWISKKEKMSIGDGLKLMQQWKRKELAKAPKENTNLT